MIKITFPDGNVREFESGITGMGIAKSIHHGLAKRSLSAKINGQVFDLFRPIEEDATIEFLSWEEKEGKSTFWHSSAH